MMDIEALVKRYEALWENDAPMEQIVGFCRHYSQKLLEDERGETPLIKILCQSEKWGEMVLMPAFLKHLTNNDDSLLCLIGSYSFRSGGHKNIVYNRILSMKKGLSGRIRAFWGAMIRKEQTFYLHRKNDNLMLVDNDEMRVVIVKNKLPGYERIPAGLYFAQGSLIGRLTTEMQNAFNKDSVSMFELELTLTGKRITIGLLRRTLREHAMNILLHLLKHRLKQVTAILSPQDLLIHICAYERNSAAALKVLDTLEELFPGISKYTDKLGNTPLWYCLYKRGREELEEALIKYGCNPDARNHLNLSYNLCKEFRSL